MKKGKHLKEKWQDIHMHISCTIPENSLHMEICLQQKQHDEQALHITFDLDTPILEHCWDGKNAGCDYSGSTTTSQVCHDYSRSNRLHKGTEQRAHHGLK